MNVNLRRISVIFIYFVIYLKPGLSDLALADEEKGEVRLEPIVVTATRIPTAVSRLTRSIEILSHEDIESAPAGSVAEVLKYVPGVDVRNRGVYGVQSDLSIRGSDFEQILILIDGIKVNDPQTGHHNMDLPLTPMDIEKIEVLRGHGSSLYGPNAFGGVINVITKKPKGKGVETQFSLGEHSLSNEILSVSYPLGKSENRLSFEKKESSGYRQDTEFDITTFYFGSLSEISSCPVDFSLGFNDKDFGADSFYSASYPQEEEHTNTRFFKLAAEVENENLAIEPKIYYRRHEDKYILDRTRPWWYTNYHTTYIYGGELQSKIRSSFGSFVAGTEVGEEKISSTNLGNHSRLREAIYMEFEPKLEEPLLANLGFRGEHYSDWGWEECPNLNMGYMLSPFTKLRSSLGYSFRVPSYTDLYYVSPANVGNSGLEPEKAYSYEVGLDYNREDIYSGVTLFRREGRNLIDWVWRNSRWEAENIGENDTNGIETTFKIKPKKLPLISSISISYVYLDSEKGTDTVSRYVLNYLRHQFCSELEYLLPVGFSQVWEFTYKDRVHGEEYFVLDTRISKKIKKDKWTSEIFIEATNLLDTSYSEQGGIPMPGRWIQTGVKFDF